MEEGVRTRRTEGVRTQGRSARVVADVMLATAEELGRVGYAALRVEDVAERAGVNKTTIYRRWPTKPSLVSASLRHHGNVGDFPDTGSLHGDLVAAVGSMLALWSSPIGKGLLRMFQMERAHPEVEQISRDRRKEHTVRRVALVERAIERGELPAGTDAHFLVELVFSPIVSRKLRDESVDEAFLDALVGFVVEGARAGYAVRGMRGKGDT